MQRINTSNVPAAIGPYSQAVKTGSLIFVSGQLPVNPATGSIEGKTAPEQAKQSLLNIKAILEEAGSSMKKVVKTTVFLANIADFGAVNEVYTEAFKDSEVLPARCAFQVAALPKAALVEIEAIAEV